MSSEWIKLGKDTIDKPEVLAVSRLCNVSHGDAFMAIMRLWCWADSNTADGNVRFLSASDADNIGKLPGLCNALSSVGWIIINPGGAIGIQFVNWEKHNGSSSKRRAQDANRKNGVRKMSAKCPHAKRTKCGPDKREEGDNTNTGNTNTSSSTTADDGCVGVVDDKKTAQQQEVHQHKQEENPPLNIDTSDCIYPKEFTEFWAAYPRKVGKCEALKAWKQTAGKRPPTNRVIESIANAKDSEQWQKDGGQFIPHPATWLRQGRWADVHEVTVKGREFGI